MLVSNVLGLPFSLSGFEPLDHLKANLRTGSFTLLPSLDLLTDFCLIAALFQVSYADDQSTVLHKATERKKEMRKIRKGGEETPGTLFGLLHLQVT